MGLFKRNTLNNFLIFCLIVSFTLGNISVFADNTSIRDLGKSSSYAKQAILELSDKNIIIGDSNGNFNPGKTVTRAEMTTIIVRALNLDMENLPEKATFKDVPKSHWAFPFIEAAYRKGIITGTSQDIFGVDDLCTREQMTAMLVRGLGITTTEIDASYGNSKINKLADKSRLSGWSRSYVEFALSTGLVTGTSSATFSPMEYAKREQAAVVTSRYLNNQNLIKTSLAKANKLTLKEIAALEKSVVLINTYDKSDISFTQGSGFCIAPGLFLTNYHVLEGASSYKIKDSTGKEYEIQGVVKYDADLDLAIIKTKEPIGIATLKIGSKDTVSKGDNIVAIGNPQGLQNSISEGIVSGLRSLDYGKTGNVDTIQITAAISQGSSGGPLFDMKGYVVGVTTAMSEDGTQKFAVAIDHAKAWIQELVPKAFKDVRVLDMSKEIDAYLHADDEEVKKAVTKAFDALEKEDIKAYMSTIHKLNPAYSTIEEAYCQIFSDYDLDYTVKEIKVVEKTFDTAKLEVKYSLEKEGRQKIRRIEAGGTYSLVKYDDTWKIISGSEHYYSTTEESPMPGQEEAPVDMKEAPLAFEVTDLVMHPTKPVFYATDKKNKKVIAYNYETKSSVESSLSLPPESIAFTDNEIYVSLLKGEHSLYWWEEEQKGAVAILDSSTLKVKEQFDVRIDPFEIAADRDGYIYLLSGSGQSGSKIKSYSRATLQEVASQSVDMQSYAVLSPTIDRIYTINTIMTPRGMSAYSISDGRFVLPGGYPIQKGWPYHGDYEMSERFRISPDGKYIFNGSGNIFRSTTNLVIGDMTYYESLSKSFEDIAFDLGSNRFFTGGADGTIYEYDYSTLQLVRTHKVQGSIKYLSCMNGKLTAVTKAKGKYYAETVSLSK